MAVESLVAHGFLDYEVGIIRGAATSMIRRCRGHAQAASTQNYLPAELAVTKHPGQDPGSTSIRSASPCRYCPPGTIHRGGKASDYADLACPNPLPRNRSRLNLGIIRSARHGPFGQLGVRGRPLRPAGLAVQPGVERGTRDLKDLAQPLHPVGVPVVSDEPEAAHQLVSSAKYLAARRRISRSVTSLACSATSSSFCVCSAAIRARNAPSSSSGDSRPRRRPGPPVRSGCDVPPDVASAPAVAAVAVWARTHLLRVRREIPRSAAIPRVAPGVGSVQVDGLATELVGVVPSGHDRGSSRFPGRGRIQRVQDQGSRPGWARRSPSPSGGYA